jgi:hypothetical protein
VSPAGELNLGSSPVGTTAPSQTVTYTNSGTGISKVSSVVATGDFAQTNTCGTVEAKGTCTVTVTFTPTALGTRFGQLTITDNSATSPHVVSLTGTGIDLSISPTTLNFGKVAVLTSSAPQTATITNVSSAPVSMTSITINGIADYGDFSETNDCPNPLPANGTCTVQVVFTPTHLLISNGAVLLVSFASADSPLAVSLNGTGEKPSNNAVPLVLQPLVPSSVAPGGSGLTLQVNGDGFDSHSVVRWNGNGRKTKYVSKHELTATILASDVASASTASVTVANPTPGGGTSSAVPFPVRISSSTVSLTDQDWGVGNSPVAIVTGVFNGHGIPDLAVANQSSNTVSILLGEGNGTFTPATTLTTGNSPSALAVGDFNGDGNLDLIVANSADSSLSVFLGNGSGGFTLGSLITGLGATDPVSVAVADFDGDGRLDFAVCNYSTNTISVYLGNGNGTFRLTSTTPVVLNGPSFVAVSDFNGDGIPDLAIANTGANTVTVTLGNGDGTFGKTNTTVPAGTAPVWIGAADFNGDGYQDLAIVNRGANSVTIVPGKGNGTFQTSTTYTVGTAPTSLAIGDVNGDGILDLVTANSGSNTVSVLLGIAGGTFQTQTTYNTNTGPSALVLSDFNNNGKLDVAVTDSTTSLISVLSQ